MRQLLLLVAGCVCRVLWRGMRTGCRYGLDCARSLRQATMTKPPAGFTKTIVLWPNGAPGAVGTGDGDVPKMFVYPAAGAGAALGCDCDAGRRLYASGRSRKKAEQRRVAECARSDGVCAGVPAGAAVPLPFSDAGWGAGDAVCAQPRGGVGRGEGQDWVVGILGGRTPGGLSGDGAR